MTPVEAMDSSNEVIVKGRLEVGRISKRRYPDVHEGDTVKVFRKKDAMDKERVSTWRVEPYKIDSTDESHGQKFYTVTPPVPNWRKPLVRSKMLLIT